MIYIIINGLLVEAETVVEIHLQMAVKKRYPERQHISPTRHHKTEENSVLTDIIREVFNEIKREQK